MIKGVAKSTVFDTAEVDAAYAELSTNYDRLLKTLGGFSSSVERGRAEFQFELIYSNLMLNHKQLHEYIDSLPDFIDATKATEINSALEHFVENISANAEMLSHHSTAYIAPFITHKHSVYEGQILNEESVKPLKPLEYILFYFVPKKDRDNVIGDLYDEFTENYARFGKVGANHIFARRALATIGPYTQARTGKRIVVWLGKLAAHLGLVAAAEEWLKKLIH